jgi:formylglycine-generating enzyme required for sulfatase activity
VKNHGETDIDCGGPSCAKCGVGKKCGGNGDCTSARCIAESGVNRCLCPDGMQRIQLSTAGGGAYCIDGEEVNNNEYAVFLATGPDIADQPAACLWNDNFTPTAAWPADVADKQLPVRHVDWCDAYAYCKKQGRRLCGKVGGGDSVPADSGKITDQWYNACSQGGTNVYPYAGLYAPKRCNGAEYWTSIDGGVPAALPRGNVSLAGCIGGPMGLIFQLSGNVKEWEDSCDGTAGKTDHCLARGGSFRSSSDELQCTGSAALARDTHADDVGFRCCL